MHNISENFLSCPVRVGVQNIILHNIISKRNSLNIHVFVNGNDWLDIRWEEKHNLYNYFLFLSPFLRAQDRTPVRARVFLSPPVRAGVISCHHSCSHRTGLLHAQERCFFLAASVLCA